MKRIIAILIIAVFTLSACAGEGDPGASSFSADDSGRATGTTEGTGLRTENNDESSTDSKTTTSRVSEDADDATTSRGSEDAGDTTTAHTSDGASTKRTSHTTASSRTSSTSKKTTGNKTSKKTTSRTSSGESEDDEAEFYDAVFSKLPMGREPSSEKTVDIVYDPNGGQVCDGSDSFTYTYATDFFTMGNTQPDNGLFIRKGYVLVGYSTQKTGGEIIGMGHKFKLPAGAKEVKLYCRWEKAADESKFKYTTLVNGTVKIKSYSGKESKVYIPRSIDGYLVSTIGNGAFKSDTLTEVYIPSGVTTIEPKAFSCPKLTKLTMFDEVTTVTDASFSGASIKTLDLQMASFPRYKDAYARKIERLVTADKPRVVYVAGSSQHYGLSTVLAEKLLGGKYTFINAGTNAQLNEVFYAEAITPLLNRGDIVVYTPEQYAINTYWAAGNPELTEMTFRIFEQNYECIKNVDMRNYTNLFGAFTKYTGIRNRQKEQHFGIVSDYIDKNGDRTGYDDKLNSPDFHNDQNGTFRFCDNFFDKSFIPNMNRMIDALKAKGVSVYFGHPSYNKNACEPSHLNEAAFKAYGKYLSEVIHCKVIADVSNYIYEGQYFANTDYHLNVYGRKIHTEQSIKDLLAVMKGA